MLNPIKLLSPFLALTLIVSAMLADRAEAQNRISLIRDAEVEHLMADYARPILQAAGLGGGQIRIVLVNSREFNAFVADGRRIFLNLGTIMQSDTPNEVIGVIAHETGHLSGAHLARLRAQIARSQAISAASIIAGAAAMVAGAVAGQRDLAGAGQGIALGGQTAAQRTLLAYQRDEELAADRAAVSYLNATGQSSRGMLRVFERFADQSMFTGRFIDPYAVTHPMARERIQQIESLARSSPHFNTADSAALQLRHDMVRARLTALQEGPRTVARRYPRSDNSMPAQYARAISSGRHGNPRDALRQFDALTNAQPGNPFIWETRGTLLFEMGRFDDAAASWRRALDLLPNNDMIRVFYGAALVQSGNDGVLSTAIGELERGLQNDFALPLGYRFLGQAYARAGQPGMAQVAAAFEAFSRGDINGAKGFAQRAQAVLPRGSPGWLRADDILSYDP